MATIGISGPSSYVAVGQQFYVHWGDVDGALGSAPLVLPGALAKSATPLGRVDFKAIYDALILQRETISEHLVDLDLARGSLEDMKRALIVRADQLHRAVRGNAPGSRYERSLPPLAQMDDSEATLVDAFTRLRQIWTKLNADTTLGIALPVTLEGGYTVEEFATQIAPVAPGAVGLKSSFDALREVEGQVKWEREVRNDMQEVLYALMKAYRQMVGTKFLEGNAILDALPALTPPQGATPPAVVIAVTWDAATMKAKIALVGPVPAGVTELEVRGVPGSSYVADDENVLGTIPLGGPLFFLTDTYHQMPGQSGTYRVFTSNSEGNEAGSNEGTATRPL